MPTGYGPKTVEMVLALKRVGYVLCIQWPKSRNLTRLINDEIIAITSHPHVKRGQDPAYAYVLTRKGEDLAASFGPRGAGHHRLKKREGNLE